MTRGNFFSTFLTMLVGERFAQRFGVEAVDVHTPKPWPPSPITDEQIEDVGTVAEAIRDRMNSYLEV